MKSRPTPEELKDEERYPGTDSSNDSSDAIMTKLGKAILETRLESEISNLFSNISVKARSIKETLQKQKSDFLVDSSEKKEVEDPLDILNTSKLSDLINLDQSNLDQSQTIDQIEKDNDPLNTTVVSVIRVTDDVDDKQEGKDVEKKDETKILDDSVISVEPDQSSKQLIASVE